MDNEEDEEEKANVEDGNEEVKEEDDGKDTDA